jgi:hypothetical protein
MVFVLYLQGFSYLNNEEDIFFDQLYAVLFYCDWSKGICKYNNIAKG